MNKKSNNNKGNILGWIKILDSNFKTDLAPIFTLDDVVAAEIRMWEEMEKIMDREAEVYREYFGCGVGTVKLFYDQAKEIIATYKQFERIMKDMSVIKQLNGSV